MDGLTLAVLAGGGWLLMKAHREATLRRLAFVDAVKAAFDIDNFPTGRAAERLMWVSQWEPVIHELCHEAGYEDVRTSSGYRSQEFNDMLSQASPTSYHRHGLALDFGGLGLWSGPRNATRYLRENAGRLVVPPRTVIAEDDHIHVDWFDPFNELPESRSNRNTLWLQERESRAPGESKFTALR